MDGTLLFSIFMGFMCSFIMIELIKPLSIRIGLVDRPDHRKLHKGQIPLIGGIAVFFGLLVGMVMTLFSDHPLDNLLPFSLACGLITGLGVLDDRFDLSVRCRLVGQAVAALIMIFFAEQTLSNLGNFSGLGEVELGILAYPFTILAVMATINAFNMVDGIDGLIGGLSLNTFLGLALLFGMSGAWSEAIVPLIFVAVLLPYLLYNLEFFSPHRSKIFMGDSGSMLIGFTVIWFLSSGTQGEEPIFRPVVALYLIALPLIDMIAIMFRRLKKGQSPFKPDRDHLHHILMRAGFNSRQSLLLLTLVSMMVSGMGIAMELRGAPEWVMFIGLMPLFAIYWWGIHHIWRLCVLLHKWHRFSSIGTQQKIQH